MKECFLWKRILHEGVFIAGAPERGQEFQDQVIKAMLVFDAGGLPEIPDSDVRFDDAGCVSVPSSDTWIEWPCLQEPGTNQHVEFGVLCKMIKKPKMSRAERDLVWETTGLNTGDSAFELLLSIIGSNAQTRPYLMDFSIVQVADDGKISSRPYLAAHENSTDEYARFLGGVHQIGRAHV